MNNDNADNIISIINLKILMYLHHFRGTTSFNKLLKYLERSKSQVSVALKKMEVMDLVSKSNGRPLLISLTEKGKTVRQKTITNMLKYKDISIKNKQAKTDKSSQIINGEEAVKMNKDEDGPITQKMKKFDLLMNDVKKIIKVELIEFFKINVPMEIVKDLTVSISNKIHDKLFEFLYGFCIPNIQSF